MLHFYGVLHEEREIVNIATSPPSPTGFCEAAVESHHEINLKHEQSSWGRTWLQVARKLTMWISISIVQLIHLRMNSLFAWGGGAVKQKAERQCKPRALQWWQKPGRHLGRIVRSGSGPMMTKLLKNMTRKSNYTQNHFFYSPHTVPEDEVESGEGRFTTEALEVDKHSFVETLTRWQK